jgi:hypothetical protein
MEAEFINDLADLYAPTTVPSMEEDRKYRIYKYEKNTTKIIKISIFNILLEIDEEQPHRIELKKKNDEIISAELLALLTINPDTLVD